LAFTSLVYVLCLLTSAVCAGLLARAYARTHVRLLLWSAACFVLLALTNLFVVAEIALPGNRDLTALRNLSSLIGISVLLYGFIWDSD